MTDYEKLKIYRHAILKIQSTCEDVNFCYIIPEVCQEILGKPVKFTYTNFPEIFRHRPFINYQSVYLIFKPKRLLRCHFWWRLRDKKPRLKILHKEVRKLERKLKIL